MASKPPASRPDSDGSSDPSALASVNDLAVNLQVVSPSVGVNRPLIFPGIAGNTSIKQLKDKIRQALPLRPADENQRLIHRGRALVRDSDTLLDIFGADTVSYTPFQSFTSELSLTRCCIASNTRSTDHPSGHSRHPRQS